MAAPEGPPYVPVHATHPLGTSAPGTRTRRPPPGGSSVTARRSGGRRAPTPTCCPPTTRCWPSCAAARGSRSSGGGAMRRASDRWTMAARRDFPLPPGAVAPLLPEADACASPEALLAEARRAGLRVVRVTKHRWRYRLGGAEAEVVRVGGPREALTVGIEAARLPDALAARDRLSLTDAPNADYGTWLRRRLRVSGSDLERNCSEERRKLGRSLSSRTPAARVIPAEEPGSGQQALMSASVGPPPQHADAQAPACAGCDTLRAGMALPAGGGRPRKPRNLSPPPETVRWSPRHTHGGGGPDRSRPTGADRCPGVSPGVLRPARPSSAVDGRWEGQKDQAPVPPRRARVAAIILDRGGQPGAPQRKLGRRDGAPAGRATRSETVHKHTQAGAEPPARPAPPPLTKPVCGRTMTAARSRATSPAMRALLPLTLLLACAAPESAAMTDPDASPDCTVLFDFTGADDRDAWSVQNDTVMGGNSRGPDERGRRRADLRGRARHAAAAASCRSKPTSPPAR